MWCEHFGIGVVELMASGVVVIAHNSGGPRSDIVVPHNGSKTGYLASTVEEYADKLGTLLTMDDSELLSVGYPYPFFLIFNFIKPSFKLDTTSSKRTISNIF